MPIIIEDIIQGTSAWFAEKAGKISASNFSKIVTPTGQESKQWKTLAIELIDQKHNPDEQEPIDSKWLRRGTELEPEARSAYMFRTDFEVRQVGLIYLDERRNVLQSPDGLIDNNGQVEFKCPKGINHLWTLHNNDVPLEHKPQLQGQLWIGEREWNDFVSYHPVYPMFIKRVYRDENYINLLKSSIEIFLDRMAKIEKEVINV